MRIHKISRSLPFFTFTCLLLNFHIIHTLKLGFAGYFYNCLNGSALQSAQKWNELDFINKKVLRYSHKPINFVLKPTFDVISYSLAKLYFSSVSESRWSVLHKCSSLFSYFFGFLSKLLFHNQLHLPWNFHIIYIHYLNTWYIILCHVNKWTVRNIYLSYKWHVNYLL